jgi:hypothetical protein
MCQLKCCQSQQFRFFLLFLFSVLWREIYPFAALVQIISFQKLTFKNFSVIAIIEIRERYISIKWENQNYVYKYFLLWISVVFLFRYVCVFQRPNQVRFIYSRRKFFITLCVVLGFFLYESSKMRFHCSNLPMLSWTWKTIYASAQPSCLKVAG